MIRKGVEILNSNILILGTTFKENCPDLRNSKVIDIVREFLSNNLKVDIVDPLADPSLFEKEYNLSCSTEIQLDKKYDCVIICVAHNSFKNLDFNKILKPKSVLYDVKSVLPKNKSDGRL